MKTPPTEIFQVTCPSASYRTVSALLLEYGCQIERSVPAVAVLDMSIGTVLRGARLKEELTQAELAAKTGISSKQISDMENNRRPIGKKNAKVLSEALNIGYRVFL